MSNSSLVVCTRISPHKDTPRNHVIDTITPHCVVGQVTAESLGGIFANPERYASSNYGVDKNGRVGLYVDENDCSWCSSNRDNDNRAVTIEVASDTTHPYAITDAAYEGLIRLMVDICQRHGKKKLLWFGDKDYTIAYNPKSDEMKMTVHRWFARKSCPGDYIYARLPAIAEEVTRRLNGGKTIVTVIEDTTGYPVLSRGSTNKTYVTKLQKRLIALDYNLGTWGADGDFGYTTYARVRDFQKDKGLEIDGVVGAMTWKALFTVSTEKKKEEAKPEAPAETTPTDPVSKLIAIAKAEIGYLEKASNSQLDDKTANAGLNNWNKYARDIDTKWPSFYNGKKNGYAWCDCFADWCFLTAFGYETTLKLLCAPERSAGAGCQYSANYYRAKGQFHRTNPQPGDQIFFGNYGSEGHIGIVVAVDANRVYTVEGNTTGGSNVVANGGGVFAKNYPLNHSGISGYGRPNWSLVGKTIATPVPAASTPTPTVKTEEKSTLTLKTLKKGDKGQLVKAAQLLLIGRNYRCGSAGADADFGSGTEVAVKSFQKACKLDADGVIGNATWNRLLNG